MNQKLICPIHQDNPIVFLNVEACQDSALACVLCVSEKKHPHNLLPIQKLEQIDEESLFDSWPPFQERKYDNINDIRKEMKILIESKQQKVEEINNWFDQLIKEVTHHILEKKNSILKQAEKASQLRQDIIKKYFEYSQNLNIKKCLKLNQSVDQIEKQLQNLIKSVHDKSESQTLMFQNLILFYKFINSQDKYVLEINQEDIIYSVKKINFFSFNTENTDLSGSNIENLFSDQANFDEFRKLISEQTLADNKLNNEFYNLMENSQNQISTTNSFIASDFCQKLNFLKIENNKLKQIDISFDNLNFNRDKIEKNQLFCYFKKVLNPNKKYTFRIRSKSFLNDSIDIKVGLIKSFKEYIPEVDIKIINYDNNINTSTEELQFIICINDNLFKVMSYPNYSTIYKSKISQKQIDNALITNQKFEKNAFQSQSKVNIFEKKDYQPNYFQPNTQYKQNNFTQNQSNNYNNNNTNYQNQVAHSMFGGSNNSIFNENNCVNNDSLTRQENQKVQLPIFQNVNIGGNDNSYNQEKTNQQPQVQETSSSGLINKNNVNIFQTNLTQNLPQTIISQDPLPINIFQKTKANITQNPTNCNNNNTNQINSQQQNLFQLNQNINNSKNTVEEAQRGNNFQQTSQISYGTFNYKSIPNTQYRDDYTTSNQQQQNNTSQFGSQRFQQHQNIFDQSTQKINEQRNTQIFKNQNSSSEYYFAIQFIYWNGDEQFKVTYFNESDSCVDGVYKYSF